ncbi:hypothetical protein TWF694_001843 [Orbilia ellipsospora]|uniref:Peptidase M12A domain-containing protein n=1 Tax=Orbilia ellipsospora TaxID=2528407 RepID=A0AAV9X3U0_9PEZI
MSSPLNSTWEGGCYEVDEYTPQQIGEMRAREAEEEEQKKQMKEAWERDLAARLQEDPNYVPLVAPVFSEPDKLAVYNNRRWLLEKIIPVKFLNGSEIMHQKVMQHASLWNEYSGVKFIFVSKEEEAYVKIGFGGDRTSWSLIGTNCKATGQNEESMHFGLLTEESSDMDYSRTVLHEFGHALGFVHEHQQPNAVGIKWNEKQVYLDCAAEMNWSEERVKEQILTPMSKNFVTGTNFDNLSIMLYPIRKSWILEATEDIPCQTTLSPLDILAVQKWYPPQPYAKRIFH